MLIGVVEDDGLLAEEIERVLVKLGYGVAFVVDTGERALSSLREAPADLVLMDIRIAGAIDGIATAAQIRRESPVPVIFLTGLNDKATLDAAMKTEPVGYLVKPFSERDIYAALELAKRRGYEERIMRRTNDRLSYFCSKVTHNLRSPLTSIIGFSSLLATNFASDMPEEGQKYLHSIEKSALRMANMLTNYFEFIQVSMAPLEMAQVSTASLLEDVILDLRPEAADISFEIQDLPSIEANSILLRLVFQNLLGNAIKFADNQRRLSIKIGTYSDKGTVVFFVTDNGIGFSDAEAQELFQPFKRLQAAARIPGEGIGLANVSTIIGRHGGKVWAEGAPGEGSTFYFSLPQQRQESENALPSAYG